MRAVLHIHYPRRHAQKILAGNAHCGAARRIRHRQEPLREQHRQGRKHVPVDSRHPGSLAPTQSWHPVGCREQRLDLRTVQYFMYNIQLGFLIYIVMSIFRQRKSLEK